MSDVSAVPAASAPAPAGEAVINPSPVSIPQPVGPQAPGKGVPDDFKGSQHRPESRREAIRASFAKVRERETPPAKATMGHNRPPEPMQREKTAPPPPEHSDRRAGPDSKAFDLRKRPADQPSSEAEKTDRRQRERGDHGHFAPRQGQPGQQPQPGQFNQSQPIPTNSNQDRPAPPRMSPQAQAEWQHTPASVRGEIHRMQHELGHAFRSLRADHEAMNEIRPFHDLARSQGTTLARAVDNYWRMEQKLRADPIGALDTIVSNLNMHTPQGQKIGLRDVAWHVLNMTPDQHRATQLQNSQTAQQMRMAELERQQQALAQQHQRMQYIEAFRRTRGEVDRYAATHPRLDELGAVIEQELKLGFDLDTAYRRADRLYPAGSMPARQQPYQRYDPRQAPSQRTPDRSIHGAPDSGPQRPSGRRPEKPMGRREAIAAAMRRVNGSL